MRLPWPTFWIHKTNKGRVVYDRKPRGFRWKDVRRVYLSRATRALPESEEELRLEFEEFTGTVLHTMLANKHFVRRMIRRPEITVARQLVFYPILKEAFFEMGEMLEFFQIHKIGEFVEELIDFFSHFIGEGKQTRTEITSGSVSAKPSITAAAQKRITQKRRN